MDKKKRQLKGKKKTSVMEGDGISSNAINNSMIRSVSKIKLFILQKKKKFGHEEATLLLGYSPLRRRTCKSSNS